jgi:hypothetical protein
MISKTTPQFWQHFDRLPKNIQRIARRRYLMWLGDPQHPSFRFKELTGEVWSVRVTDNYRACGYREQELIVWTWIGTHAQYDRRIG